MPTTAGRITPIIDRARSGDVQVLLAWLEQADQSARATADAVTEATAQYRDQVDELVSKLRAETASIVLKTTEHAAHSLVGQQQATLQQAATLAMQQTITAQVLRRTRQDWLMAAALGAMSGSMLTIVLFTMQALLFGR